MKKLYLMIIVILSIVLFIPFGTVHAEDNKALDGFSRYLIDEDSGMVIEKFNEDERHQIASMVKIMSLNVIFDKIDDGSLGLDDKVTISKHAASQGGSELFVDAGKEYIVDDLIKGIVVVSANDATVALAEYIANNEDNFVKLMNEKADEYNLKNTKFVNATGLPHDGQYSSAKDVTIMMKHLLSHKKYFDYSKIWMEDYTHPSGRTTSLVNTNKLIRFYDGCDAGKTGYTDKASFCLSATAKRNDIRVIGTIIGAKTSKDRFRMMSNMFNDTFKNYSYKVIKSKSDHIDNDIIVRKARGKKVDVVLSHDIKVLMKKDSPRTVDLSYEMVSEVKAPIKAGDVVGTCHVSVDGGDTFDVPLVANNNIDKSSIFDDFIVIGRH